MEEQLLGPGRLTGNEDVLRAVAGRLSDERVALSQLEAELEVQRARVSELARQLEAIAAGSGQGVEPTASTLDDRRSRSLLVLRSTIPAPDRDYWLSRCEGFLVESPAGRGVGVVEGARFALRIDRPDLLEVAVGRLRRRVLLVPVDEVEHVSGDEERVVLSHDPLARHNVAQELLARARGKLHLSPS